MSQLSGSKSFDISKQVVFEAHQKVKANKGAAGVDGESIEQCEADLKGNLYKLWNRMSSGTYFPPPVRMVEIDKPGGSGVRVLGVPTVADTIAQTVAAMYLEPEVEPIFHPDSYGYRPGRSALDAVGACRERCWSTDWVIDMDIQGFFDNLDHDLVLKAVAHHTDQRWILLYVQRWLVAPLQRRTAPWSLGIVGAQRARRSRPQHNGQLLLRGATSRRPGPIWTRPAPRCARTTATGSTRSMSQSSLCGSGTGPARTVSPQMPWPDARTATPTSCGYGSAPRHCAPKPSSRPWHVLVPVIARRGTENGSGLGIYRWYVERSFAWLHAFKRLRTRYERCADIHQALISVVCSAICVRPLNVN